jgi:hypothetical protein
MNKQYRFCFPVFVSALFLCLQLSARPAMPAQWIRTYHSQFFDEGLGCSADTNGFLYVVGGSATAANMSNFQWIIIKYDIATGDTVWTRQYASASTGFTIASGCAAGKSGALFVTGMRAAGTGSELFTIKYNGSTGDTVWTRSYPSGSASDCRLDSSYLYVTGLVGSGGAGNDYFTIKYSPSTGDTLWTRRFDGAAHNRDEAYGCAPDHSGNLYVTGYSFNGTSYNLLTIKYNANGDTLWTRRSSDTLDSMRYVRAGCGADRAGNVYVAGMCGTEASSGNRYGVLIKYDLSGTQLWAKHFDGPTNYDAFNTCGPDSGRVYALGVSNNGSNDDAIAVTYDAATGDTLKTRRYNGTLNEMDMFIGGFIEKSGNRFAVGMTNAYDSAAILVENFGIEGTNAVRISKKTETPSQFKARYHSSTAKVVISFHLTETRHVSISVVDQRGRRRATIVDGDISGGRHEAVCDVQRFPAGLYLCRMMVDGWTDRVEKIFIGK